MKYILAIIHHNKNIKVLCIESKEDVELLNEGDIDNRFHINGVEEFIIEGSITNIIGEVIKYLHNLTSFRGYHHYEAQI